MPAAWVRTGSQRNSGSNIPSFKVRWAGCHLRELTAAVSNFGGLGSFGALGLTPEAIKDVIAQIRSLTSSSMEFPHGRF